MLAVLCAITHAGKHMATILAVILILAILWLVLEISIIMMIGLFIVAAFGSHTEAGNLIGFIGLIIAGYAMVGEE